MLNEHADKSFAERGIILDPIPGEAHWQIGIVERSIQSAKRIVEAIASEFPEMSDDELLGRAMWVSNAKDLYKGFSPLQHAAGRTPDEEMRMFETTDEKPLHGDLMEDGGFGQNIWAMCVAEKAFVDEQARQRLQRAQAMGHRKTSIYAPGDLVYYWRRQQAGAHHQNFPKGRFLGPAPVLATETRREPDGTLRPASVVWLHRGGRLLRAAPEQLRHASPRENLVEELKGPVEIFWTMASLATSPARRTFHDISQEIPDDIEWEGARDMAPQPGDETGTPVHQDEGPPRRRFGSKRPHEAYLPGPDVARKDIRTGDKRGTKRGGDEDLLRAGSRVPLRGVGSQESHPPESDTEELMTAVEIHIDIPESTRGWKKFVNNPAAYFCQKMKRKQVEVCERKLTKEEKQEFDGAKDKEVRNFVAAECFKTWSGRELKESEVMGMRWLLT